MRFRHRPRPRAPHPAPGPPANIGTAARRARRRRARAGVVAGIAVGALAFFPPAATAAPQGGEDRLLLTFIEDGALIDKAWIEFAGVAREADEGRDLGLSLRAAFRYGRDAEAGVDLTFLNRQRDAGAPLYGAAVVDPFEHTGVSDPIVYGKYRLLRGACDLAIGARASIPVAPDDSGLTSGAWEGRGFVAFRGAWRQAALIGHLGIGVSSDAHYEEGAAGRTFATASIGSVVALSRLWNLLAEISFEGARFGGEEERGRGLVGLDWHPTVNIRVRGGVGSGWGSESGAFSGIAAMAFHF